jgi:hypothetical protein
MFDRLPKHSAAYVVAIGGLLLTCLSSWNVRHELQTSHQREFEWAAADRIQSVRAVVGQGLDALQEITALFHSAQAIDENEFQVFAGSLLARRSYIDSLLWAPLLISPRQGSPLTAPPAADLTKCWVRANCGYRCFFPHRAPAPEWSQVSI